nr:IS110 family transposase [Gordonia polyisoprenivorans]
MTAEGVSTQPVYAGVDTHKDTHHAGIVDDDGRQISDAEFGTDRAGNEAMLEWLAQWWVHQVAVEQTGSYGLGLTTVLREHGYTVKELNRPDPTVRATVGKSDPVDAYTAAQAARTGRADITPKDHSGIVESIRMLSTARASAVKARSVALNQIRDLVITAPVLREKLTGLTTRKMVAVIWSWRPNRGESGDPVQGAKLALRGIAGRVRDLDTEIKAYDTQLNTLTRRAAPRLRARPQVGPMIAAQLLVTVGQCPDRIGSDAQFARLAGIAPIPASSGKTSRMRLHRGGDRHANSAVHLVVIGRLRKHENALAYREKRRAEGMADKDIIRAMKRLVARELFYALKADLKDLDHTTKTSPRPLDTL